MSDVQTPTAPFGITDSAAKRIATILAGDEHKGLMLRISVSGGGCSGFQYGFTFDDAPKDDDKLFERQGAKVLIDETSLELLSGSEIDYVDEMIGSSFQIKNPQAKSTCGCGNSFSV